MVRFEKALMLAKVRQGPGRVAVKWSSGGWTAIRQVSSCCCFDEQALDVICSCWLASKQACMHAPLLHDGPTSCPPIEACPHPCPRVPSHPGDGRPREGAARDARPGGGGAHAGPAAAGGEAPGARAGGAGNAWLPAGAVVHCWVAVRVPACSRMLPTCSSPAHIAAQPLPTLVSPCYIIPRRFPVTSASTWAMLMRTAPLQVWPGLGSAACPLWGAWLLIAHAAPGTGILLQGAHFRVSLSPHPPHPRHLYRSGRL